MARYAHVTQLFWLNASGQVNTRSHKIKSHVNSWPETVNQNDLNRNDKKVSVSANPFWCILVKTELRQSIMCIDFCNYCICLFWRPIRTFERRSNKETGIGCVRDILHRKKGWIYHFAVPHELRETLKNVLVNLAWLQIWVPFILHYIPTVLGGHCTIYTR